MKTRNAAISSLQIRANRYDLISRLATDLAHEIRNPIHAAVINLELLRRRAADGPADARLERIHALDGQLTLIHERVDWLLQLLRPSTGPAARLDVDQIVAELLPPLERIAGLAGVALRYEPAGTGDRVEIDRVALKHAFLDLVVDALDALRLAGGSLEIRTDSAPDEVHLRVRRTGRGGAGLPRDDVPTDEPEPPPCTGRTGLGLAVACALVEEAGGRIVVEDRGDDGSGPAYLLALPRVAGA